MKSKLYLILLSFLCLYSCKDDELSTNPSSPEGNNTTQSDSDWWQEARFGLFIHYGIYSVLGGEYIGNDIYGNYEHFETLSQTNTPDATKKGAGAGAEWIMKEALIPKETYKGFATEFMANNFDPQYIVSLAKNAGMRYVVLTSKHHDSFCLWNSSASDWNITKSPAGSRWNNDLIMPVANAARAAGLRFGIYFSQFRDWMLEGAPEPVAEMVEGGSYTLEQQEAYMKNYTYPMITELLENYKPDIFWWDGPNNNNAEFARRCDEIIRSQGYNIIQNDRLAPGIGYGGDFETPEQTINEELVKENSELCMTLNGTWGYSKFDLDWKESPYVLYTLLKAQKLGCNLLLNVGPKGDGSIPAETVEVLEDLAGWMKYNDESAHGTVKSPFSYNLPYGPTTFRKLNGRQNMYYHIFYWDKNGELWIPGIMNQENEVEVSFPSAPNIKPAVESISGIGLRITGLPQTAPHKMCSTLKVSFLSEPVLDEGARFINGTLYLDALAAKTTGSYLINEWEEKPALCWYSGRAIKYKVVIPKNGEYEISSELAAFFNGTITFRFVKVSGDTKTFTLTGNNKVTPSGHANFEWQDMGKLYLEKGTYELTIESKNTSVCFSFPEYIFIISDF